MFAHPAARPKEVESPMTSTSLASPPRSSSPIHERARLLQSFETALEAAGLSPATCRLYDHGVRRLYAFLERLGLDAPLSGVSAEHLREWLNAERRAGASPATIEALHKSARRLWRFLLEEGEATEDVAARLPVPKVPVKMVRALTREQISALCRTCQRDRTVLGLRDQAIIACLLDTGLRAAELLSLTVEGLDRRERRALVMGKGARERLVSFEAKTLRLIDRYHRRAGIDAGQLFRGRSGEPLSQAALYLTIRRRGRQASIEGLHPHRFRHTTASALLEAGLQEGDVRVIMGWSRQSHMLERYTASRAAERALEARGRVRLLN